jgi:predicted PhzF superfamily epimerase YddE/YHI9
VRPRGGVVEDTTTGAATAALDDYLREIGRAQVGDRLVIEQGVEMVRPSIITINLGTDTVLVSVAAVAIPTEARPVNC